jgi:hypothetical protein
MSSILLDRDPPLAVRLSLSNKDLVGAGTSRGARK